MLCYNALLAPETLLLTRKNTFWPKVFQKVSKLRQILILRQNSVCQGFKFLQNFSAKALRAFAQLLPPWLSEKNCELHLLIKIANLLACYCRYGEAEQLLTDGGSNISNEIAPCEIDVAKKSMFFQGPFGLHTSKGYFNIFHSGVVNSVLLSHISYYLPTLY